jgi:hypothetical protein
MTHDKPECFVRNRYVINPKNEIFWIVSKAIKMGILRDLFVTRNNNTTPFIKWPIEVLFITQMGTNKDKQKLASDILGINAQIVKVF